VHPIEHLRYVARARGADPASLVEETAHALGSLRFDPSGVVVACRRIVERHPFTGALWWLCANVTTSVEPFDAVWELAEQIQDDPTGSHLADALADDATVVTVGAPNVIGDGLIRRGDVRVLAVDAGHEATSFVRRLERHDVAYEPVDAGAAGSATRAADVVLIEALAVDSSRIIAPIGSSTIAACAHAWGTPVWLVAGTGRRLPSGMIDAMVDKVAALTDPQGAYPTDPWELDVEVIPTSFVTAVVGPHGRVPMGPPAIVAECPMAYELLRPGPM
jgi:translation initiation factor 2B subunit (eIF-2B alpha/beta/delta family)